MSIANDYVPNYDFATCQDWIDWMNKQPIVLGQPYIKEDKKSRLLPLESRVSNVALAQPANRRFNPSIRRMYLPRSAEQVMTFFIDKDVVSQISASSSGFDVWCLAADFREEDKDIMKVFGKLIAKLKQVKKVK